MLWTDEATIEIGKNFRQIRVWRSTKETYEPDCLAPTFRSGRTSVMIWGAFYNNLRSSLGFMIPGKRTALDFVDIVYEGPLKDFLLLVPGAILMEDGAMCIVVLHQKNGEKIEDCRSLNGRHGHQI